MSDAKQAATVILLRPDASGGGPPELLLIERAATLAFAGGAMVFPGGRVEPGDRAVVSFHDLDEDDAAGRVAAARETFEEVGVLLTAGPPLDAATRAHWRTRLCDDSAGFDAFLAATGHALDLAALTPFAHWVPPAGADIARRYDTRFYLALCPPDEAHEVDAGETVAAHWTTAAAAVARADAGEIGLVFPTRRNLERLAQYASLDTLLAAARARPPRLIQPAIERRDDGALWLTIPTDADYPITAERLDAVRRE